MALKGQTRDSNTVRAHYLENSWRCYLATIAIVYIVCCEAVRSAIQATAWLLVLLSSVKTHYTWHVRKQLPAECFGG